MLAKHYESTEVDHRIWLHVHSQSSWNIKVLSNQLRYGTLFFILKYKEADGNARSISKTKQVPIHIIIIFIAREYR